jgi:microcystin-dependent protein
MAQSEKDVAMENYTSSIKAWPARFAPIDTEFCHGQYISISQNPALYSVIGITFGGDHAFVFGLPDLRGRVPLGVGAFKSTFGQFNFELGSKNGGDWSFSLVKTQTAVTLSAENVPGHTHPATFMPAKSDVPIDIKVRGDQSVNIPVGATVPTTTTPETLRGPQYLSNYQAGLQSSKGGFVDFPPDSTVNLATGSGGVTLTGRAGVTASPRISVLTGGTVEVQSQNLATTPTPIQISATAPMTMSTFQPSLALNFIITMLGYYPRLPTDS